MDHAGHGIYRHDLAGDLLEWFGVFGGCVRHYSRRNYPTIFCRERAVST